MSISEAQTLKRQRDDARAAGEVYRRQYERCAADLKAFGEVFEALTRAMATNVRDWGADRMDAFLWGVFLGWDCDVHHEHNEIDCSLGAMDEIAARHGWDDRQVERVRRFHRAVLAAAGQPAPNSGSNPTDQAGGA